MERQTILERLKENLAKAQNRMKHQADKGRIEKQFNIGDWVWVKLQPYWQHSVLRRPLQKLSKRFFGPFKILQKIGQVAYKLELPQSSRMHPVFHVSLLKPYKGALPATSIPLPQLIEEDDGQ